MKLKKGDVVAVIEDSFRGKIKEIKGEKVTIITEDDFEIVYNKEDLVKITEDQKELAKYRDIKNKKLSQKSDDYVNKKILSKSKLKFPSKERAPKHTMEVDLHIEKLIPKYKGMSNFDIMSIQLETARQKIEFAIDKKISKIIFIHGIGDGVLKEELKYLFGRYHVDVKDASYQKYGLGATEVYLYQSNFNN
ncbi:Smr/MutS family protein [Aureivirga sp. CE67]|uniref:Smr/MutS family protein n=1 Tax=Aureivirga sp. CE67 TaxID=1788983 RepID=UPI0018C99EFC|nr:Smr/MutS family protein [Aureivirga sp. CE67]